MGCDIHPGLFVLRNNKWAQFLAVPPDERHYDFFGLLAGVRGDTKPIAEPRGMPEWFPGADKWWAEYIVDGDHTPSWLSLQELENRLSLPDRDDDIGVTSALSEWVLLGRFYQKADTIWRATNREMIYVFNFDS